MDRKRQDLQYAIRRQPRPDGLFFWVWNVTDYKGYTLASGAVYGSRSKAVKEAQKTIATCQRAISSRGSTGRPISPAAG